MADEDSYKNSFHGRIEEIDEISVDNFDDRNKMAYFLSHMHSDHTQGLFGRIQSEQLRNNGAKIYMSKESHTILKCRHYNYDILEDIVEPLETGLTHNIDLPDERSFQLTLIPVKHMVGAVMFLFKTKNKTILFTGDFLIDKEEIVALRKLHRKENGPPINIDHLYVDSTFDKEEYEHFPSRAKCHDEVVKLAEEWLVKRSRRLALASSYQFGYDDLYQALYRRLQIKTFVGISDPRKERKTRENLYQVYAALHGAVNFITNNASSQIHICNNFKSDDRHIPYCGVTEQDNMDYLHIWISAGPGRNYDPRDPEHKSLTVLSDNSYYLCYATHCSRSQLNSFINYFNPGKITRFPKDPYTPPNPSPRTPYKRPPTKHRNSDVGRVVKRLFPNDGK